MALEVARAYDENKNLVPLYIATDSDPVYDPVTPGFAFGVYSYSNEYDIDITIINNAMNPTGGDIPSTNIENLPYSVLASAKTVNINCVNNSNFDIMISINMVLYRRSSSSIYSTLTIVTESSLSVPKGQKVKIRDYTTSISDTRVSAYAVEELMIQRVL